MRGQQKQSPFAIQHVPERRELAHPVLLQPAFGKLAEALGFLDAALFALLLLGGRPPFLNRAVRVDQLLSRTRQRQAGSPIAAEGQGLAPAVHTVVVTKHDRPRRLHDDIHTVTIRDLVQFILWFQCFDSGVCQH